MASSVVQWTVDQLWSGLQQIANGFNSVAKDLNADKAQLTALWSATKSQPAATAAANQKLLTPLIHQNSVLRLSYLQPIRDKYNQALALAKDALAKAGYTVPGNLAGLGFVFAIAPVAAVTIVIAALALLATAIALTSSQRTNTANVARVIGDATTTPEQKAALLAAMEKELKAQPPPGIDFGPIALAALAVAAIVIVPKLLPSRKAAA